MATRLCSLLFIFIPCVLFAEPQQNFANRPAAILPGFEGPAPVLSLIQNGKEALPSSMPPYVQVWRKGVVEVGFSSSDKSPWAGHKPTVTVVSIDNADKPTYHSERLGRELRKTGGTAVIMEIDTKTLVNERYAIVWAPLIGKPAILFFVVSNPPNTSR